jgi:hypothetical protein
MKCFSYPKRPDRHWGSRNLLLSGYGASLSGVKRPGRKVNNSPLSSRNDKNEWSYVTTPPLWLYSVNRENFTLFASLLLFKATVP